jgi:hypothetical protein
MVGVALGDGDAGAEVADDGHRVDAEADAREFAVVDAVDLPLRLGADRDAVHLETGRVGVGDVVRRDVLPHRLDEHAAGRGVDPPKQGRDLRG